MQVGVVEIGGVDEEERIDCRSEVLEYAQMNILPNASSCIQPE
jgi:hypothetical protein